MKKPDYKEFETMIAEAFNSYTNPAIMSPERAKQKVREAYNYMASFLDSNSAGSKLPDGEEFVAMVTHQDKAIIASTTGIYHIVDGKLKLIPLEHE